MGRVADQLAPSRREEMLINVGTSQSLAVKSRLHTPLVFDDPNRFQRNGWMNNAPEIEAATSAPVDAITRAVKVEAFIPCSAADTK